MFGEMMQKYQCRMLFRSLQIVRNIILTLSFSLHGCFCTQILITSRQNISEDGMSLLTAGRSTEFGRVLYSVTVHAFSLSAPSSYHAVQGWMDELRIDVGEAGKLTLVDVGDDQLVGRGQHGLGACEKLVEVFCSFAALKEIEGRLDVERIDRYFDQWTLKDYKKNLG